MGNVRTLYSARAQMISTVSVSWEQAVLQVANMATGGVVRVPGPSQYRRQGGCSADIVEHLHSRAWSPTGTNAAACELSIAAMRALPVPVSC